MSNKGTMEIVAREMALALAPLKDATSDLESFKFFLRQIGWNADDLPPDYSALFSDIESILSTVESLPQGADLDNIMELLDDVSSLYDALKNLTVAPSGTDALSFLNEFFGAAFEFVLARYFMLKLPKVYNFMEFTGIFTTSQLSSVPGRPSFVRYKFDSDKISSFIENPISLFDEVYNWGASDFLIQPLLRRVFNWTHSLGLNPRLVYEDTLGSSYNLGTLQGPSDLSRLEIPFFGVYVANEYYELGISISELKPSTDQDRPGIIIEPLIPSEMSASFAINENWTFNIGAYTTLFEKFAIIISPTGINVELPTVLGGDGLPENGVNFEFTYNPETPLILLGNPDKSRVEFKGAVLGAGIAGSSFENFEITAEADLQNFKIIIKASEGDGFLKKVLGDEEFLFESDFGVKWSNISGFNFKGGGGALVVQLAEHIEIGPLSIEQLTLAIRSLAGGTPGMSTEVSANVGLELGPFAAVVEGLGVDLKVKFEEGNAGPFDIGVGFKPPSGVGFVIDASAIKGGGFLSFDFEEERYIGALELSIKDKVALKVIGILTTKLPGNDDGYSLLLLITAEFEPINLGFGFTLNGVGGLIALNRTMNLNYLRDGIKSNTLDNILFPTDPIENINQIISDLEGAFPVEEGRYAFGPMAIIGWGTPTLITVELGLMIEVPSPVRLAVLGVVKAILPTEEKSLLKVQVNFLGTIDFEAKYITFDASIFASKLLTFTLEGDMAFRLKWGDNPNFLFSIGGFHPSFTPPPLDLPSLNRLTINLLGGDNPRLTLTSYFAVTSNTVQFGSAVDFYYKITNKYKVIGYLGFDILIQFNPFYLIASIAAQLAVMKNNEAVLNIYLGATLSGPAPWNVKGSAEFKVFGIKLKVKFDKTFGQPETTTLPNVDVLPRLIEAIENKANWRAVSSSSNLLVTLRELENAPGDVVAHPYGSIGVSQKVVPLDMAINKFGTQRPADYQKFSLDIADAGGTNLQEEDVQDFFAPAEYLELSDSSKLSRKSFEEFNSGVIIKGGDELRSSYLMERELEYEQVIMDSRHIPDRIGLVKESAVRFNAFRKNGTAAKSKLGSKSKPKSENAPAKVAVQQEKFAIAHVDDLTQYGGMEAGSEAEARVMLEELLNDNPALEDSIQVVPFYEVA